MTKQIGTNTKDRSAPSLKKMEATLVFMLNQQQYALPLSSVERVVHVIEFTKLPKAPKNILGVINLHGLIVPVYNTRRCLGLPPRDILLSDQLIIIQIYQRTIALLVDSVIGVLESPEQQVVISENVSLDMKSTERILKQEDAHIILINELDKLLELNKRSEQVIKND